MASKVYALEVKKADMALIKFLNDGIPLDVKNDHYLVFELGEDGKSITTTDMTKREMYAEYDISGYAPFLVRCRKTKS